MGLSFEVSTLVLLFAPLFLPKLFSVAGRLLSASASSESAHPKHTHATSRVAISKSSWKQRFLPSNYLKVAPAILLAVYTVLSLVYLKPFNLFTSLGQLPITAPAGQIQLALSRFGLLDKYADDLNLLTSLDRRVLYLHYGHSNFVGCQQLLGSTAPRDLLAYSSIRILQGAVGKGLLLALSNRRWKVSLFIASIAVALYQIYALATTTPQISNPEEAYLTLSHLGPFWSNLGILLLCISAMILPSKHSERALTPDEMMLIQAAQALVQRQDMIQTRIRVMEAAQSMKLAQKTDTTNVIGNRLESTLSHGEQQGLKNWLRAIASSQPRPMSHLTSTDTIPNNTAKQSLTLSTVGADEPVDKAEMVSKPSDQLQLPKSSSLQTMGDASFATAQVVVTGTSDDEEDNLRSPSLSRSSSMSSHIDTPTPAMRRPMSLDLTAAASKIAQELEKNDFVDDDRPLNKKQMEHPVRLTQSLGPSGPAKHPNLLPQPTQAHEMFATRSVPPRSDVDTLIDQPNEVRSDLQGMDSASDDAQVVPRSLSHREDSVSAVNLTTKPYIAPIESVTSTSSNSTPSLSATTDDGWTTVLSKKSKSKT